MRDPKQIVLEGYDRCGPQYNAARARDASPELKLLLRVLPPAARVLDVGCGAGVPVTAALARRGMAIGVDISEVQIEQARAQVPDATFILGDIMAQRFDASSFDAVVAFYALFHIPRGEHFALLERMAAWIRPGGHLLATLADSAHPGYTEPDFFGAKMYWSHFEPSWYERAVQKLGFKVLERRLIGHGYRDIPGLPAERHPLILARRVRSPEMRAK